MQWADLDRRTKVGLGASLFAVVAMLVPPIGMAIAVVAIGSSGSAWRRSHRLGLDNRVARFCTLGCAALVAIVVAGNVIYNGGW